jgi:CDP-glucose 4,6-dehydratase
MFEVYKGKKVLVTGCCGFKGSWLCHWLRKLGAEVIGFGHYPRTIPSHHNILNSPPPLIQDLLGMDDLYGYEPDLVFHLAAKAIVARTFHEPRETFENNVMGTVNLLEACRHQPSIKGIVLITTDKVYANKEWDWGYRENDQLGGLDPYSASKVCIEHVIECYRSQFIPNIATARAGNVIGGGDWAEKRLIPDIVRATVEGKEVEIHTPNATRPWQHVTEPLCGYLMLGQKFLECDLEHRWSKPWNFGPEGEMTVLDILKIAKEAWPKIEYVVKEEETHPSMTTLLKIDSTEARKKLGWKPRWNMEMAVRMTIMWYKEYYEKGIVRTNDDINLYEGFLHGKV